MSGRLVAVAVLVWTGVSWGGRIGLLTNTEAGDPWTLVRVGGSIVIGLATAHVLWWQPSWRNGVVWLFVIWTVSLWLRSLVVAWIDPPSTSFGLVHTALAIGWFLLAALVARQSATATTA